MYSLRCGAPRCTTRKPSSASTLDDRSATSELSMATRTSPSREMSSTIRPPCQPTGPDCREHRASLPFLDYAGVQVHVVPAIAVQQRTAQRGLEMEPGLVGDAAGCGVGHGVTQAETVQAQFVQGPAAGLLYRAGGDAAAAGGRQHPVADFALASLEIDVSDGRPAGHVAPLTGHNSPAGRGLIGPAAVPARDQLPRLVLGCDAPPVPVPDPWVGVSGQHGRGVGRQPRPEDRKSTRHEDWLIAVPHPASGYDGREETGHGPIIAHGLQLTAPLRLHREPPSLPARDPLAVEHPPG